MPEHDLAELELKLDAGGWLSPGEVAALLETSRQSIDRWIKAGKLRYRKRGNWRFLHPEDVRRELDEYRRERRNGTGEPGDGPVSPETPPAG